MCLAVLRCLLAAGTVLLQERAVNMLLVYMLNLGNHKLFTLLVDHLNREGIGNEQVRPIACLLGVRQSGSDERKMALNTVLGVKGGSLSPSATLFRAFRLSEIGRLTLEGVTQRLQVETTASELAARLLEESAPIQAVPLHSNLDKWSAIIERQAFLQKSECATVLATVNTLGQHIGGALTLSIDHYTSSTRHLVEPSA